MRLTGPRGSARTVSNGTLLSRNVRSATEPRRLGLRYLRNNPRFVGLLLLQHLGLRRFPLVLTPPAKR